MNTYNSLALCDGTRLTPEESEFLGSEKCNSFLKILNQCIDREMPYNFLFSLVLNPENYILNENDPIDKFSFINDPNDPEGRVVRKVAFDLVEKAGVHQGKIQPRQEYLRQLSGCFQYLFTLHKAAESLCIPAKDAHKIIYIDKKIPTFSVGGMKFCFESDIYRAKNESNTRLVKEYVPNDIIHLIYPKAIIRQANSVENAFIQKLSLPSIATSMQFPNCAYVTLDRAYGKFSEEDMKLITTHGVYFAGNAHEANQILKSLMTENVGFQSNNFRASSENAHDRYKIDKMILREGASVWRLHSSFPTLRWPTVKIICDYYEIDFSVYHAMIVNGKACIDVVVAERENARKRRGDSRIMQLECELKNMNIKIVKLSSKPRTGAESQSDVFVDYFDNKMDKELKKFFHHLANNVSDSNGHDDNNIKEIKDRVAINVIRELKSRYKREYTVRDIGYFSTALEAMQAKLHNNRSNDLAWLDKNLLSSLSLKINQEYINAVRKVESAMKSRRFTMGFFISMIEFSVFKLASNIDDIRHICDALHVEFDVPETPAKSKPNGSNLSLQMHLP